MFRRNIYALIAIIILGGLTGAIAYYAFDFKPKFLVKVILGQPRPPEVIAAEAARIEQWQPIIKAIGTLTPSEGINLAPHLGGTVNQVNFDSGQDVKKGQLLAALNTDTEHAELQSFQSELANARLELERKQTLINKGLAPRNEIDLLKTKVLTLEAAIERLQSIVKQKTIYAPWDGRVGLRQVSLGSYVGAGQTLLWLQRLDPIFVDFPVTEQQFSQIKLGQAIEAKFNGLKDKVFKGKISAIDAKLSDQSRMITLRATIDNPEKQLLPGMYADVAVQAGTPSQVLTIPQTAVNYSLYGESVYVAVPQASPDQSTGQTTSTEQPTPRELITGQELRTQEPAPQPSTQQPTSPSNTPSEKPEPTYKVDRHFIKTGEVQQGRVAVTEGLNVGDMIIIAGQNKIEQGNLVIINNDIALKANDPQVIQ